MKERRWFIGTLTAVILILALMASAMIYIDPYFHYHGPAEGRPYALYGGGAMEKYYNDGIGKHFEYDAMITGSSVTENFQASHVESLWNCTAVKTCLAGGTLKEVDLQIRRALSVNDGVSMVIRGIDENKLFADKDGFPSAAPTYLYDNNIFNDVNYLFNKDTWLVAFRRNIQFMRNGEESTNFDEYSDWTIKAVFSKERTLSVYERPDVSTLTEKEELALLANIQGNIEQNIVATVRDNPDVTFYYFLTPTSVCQWDSWKRQGQLEWQLLAEKLLIEALLPYENVRLYGFSDKFDMITNLDNYMDAEHFSDEINAYILVWMRNGEGLLTSDNYMQYINKIGEFYRSYDYEGLFNQQ